jgi:hypothetical protein
MSKSDHQFQAYEPEMRTVQKDLIYAVITAIASGLDHARDNLAQHEAAFGRARPRHKREAEFIEGEIAQMEAALAGLRETGPSRTCPKCGGHGKVDVQSGPYERTCESCGGTGKREAGK